MERDCGLQRCDDAAATIAAAAIAGGYPVEFSAGWRSGVDCTLKPDIMMMG